MAGNGSKDGPARAEPVLRAEGVGKSFGAVRVLREVNFEVRPGEVVALIGDNGAGKSTLINVLTGVFPPDEGEIIFEGERVVFASPHEGRERGIEAVYQDLAVAPQGRCGEHLSRQGAPQGGDTKVVRVSGPAKDAKGDRRTARGAARADPKRDKSLEHLLGRATTGRGGGSGCDVG